MTATLTLTRDGTAGRASHPAAVRIAVGVASLAAANLAVLVADDHLSLQLLLALALLVAPGWLVLRWCGYRAANVVAGAVVTAATSLTVLMLVPLGLNYLGQAFGLSRPLTAGALLVAFDVVLVVLLVGALRQPNESALRWPSWHQVGIVGAALALPLLALAGAARLNAGGSGLVAALVALAAGAYLLAGFLAAGRVPDWVPALLLVGAAAALILSFSTRGSYLFGYDIQQEFGTFTHLHADSVWNPSSTDSADDAYRAMLSITLLPEVFVELCRLAPLDVFRVLLPLPLVMVPAAVFGFVRTMASPRIAFGVALLPMLQPQFASQLPAVARQSVALATFGALLAVLLHTQAPSRARTVVAVLLSTGLVLSHYTTAYTAVAVLLGAWILTHVTRLARRDRQRRPRVLSGLVVWWLTGFCLLWNVVLTDSVTNVHDLAANMTGRGLQVLPADRDASALERWLKAPVPPALGGEEYSSLVDQEYRIHHPWVQHYDSAAIATAPLRSDRAPVAAGLAPGLKAVFDATVTLVNQLVILAVVLAVAAFAMSARHARDARGEIALLATMMLLLTALGRVSGTVIASYNAERLYVQGLMVFAVALAYGFTVLTRPDPGPYGRHDRRRSPLTAAALPASAVAAGVLFLNATQVAVPVVGGSPSPNLASQGEAAERYLYTHADVALAAWVNQVVPEDAPIFVDRYGVLPLWNAIGRDHAVFSSVAPSAVDSDGYVLLTHTNLTDRRSRGSVGRAISVFQTPVSFYDQHKDLIYATASTRIYR
ncbi:hypothetical protein [Micromonospora psammae]|uniref:hypothetical protein n=1 Tax=Micromonospora sp. CPCC 205556 TaxID=3122398 RepID=UPI002FF23910